MLTHILYVEKQREQLQKFWKFPHNLVSFPHNRFFLPHNIAENLRIIFKFFPHHNRWPDYGANELQLPLLNYNQ